MSAPTLKKILIYHSTTRAPLVQAAYLKFFSMFYGLEELAIELYDSIVRDYQCVAANLHKLFEGGEYPQNGIGVVSVAN